MKTKEEMKTLLKIKNKKRFKKVSALSLILLSSVGLAACGAQQKADQQNSANTSAQSNITYASATDNKLANLQYRSGKQAVVPVNHNRAQLSKNWTSDHVTYSPLDKLTRTSNPNTGWIDKQNLANDSGRLTQTYKPTGWHQRFQGNTPLINRGHEIAYSLSKGINQQGKYSPKDVSGDQNNPKNLFTQTAFSNQQLQAIYEGKVRNALKQGKKVVYQVQPIFKGKDLMANGVRMQAVSTDGSLNFDVFIYNVQPHEAFNYATGLSHTDNKMNVPLPPGVKPIHYNDNNNGNFKWHKRYRYHYSYRRHHYVRNYMIYHTAKHVVKHIRHHHHMRMRGRLHSIRHLRSRR